MPVENFEQHFESCVLNTHNNNNNNNNNDNNNIITIIKTLFNIGSTKYTI